MFHLSSTSKKDMYIVAGKLGRGINAQGMMMNAVTFLGDAPKVKSNDTFKYSSSIIYRKPEAKGWGDTFAGRPVKLISEKPYPMIHGPLFADCVECPLPTCHGPL